MGKSDALQSYGLRELVRQLLEVFLASVKCHEVFPALLHDCPHSVHHLTMRCLHTSIERLRLDPGIELCFVNFFISRVLVHLRASFSIISISVFLKLYQPQLECHNKLFLRSCKACALSNTVRGLFLNAARAPLQGLRIKVFNFPIHLSKGRGVPSPRM